MNSGLTLLTFAALAASGAAAAPRAEGPACSRAAVVAAGRSVRAARVELKSIPLEADGTLVPPSARRAIERVKDRLRGLVRAEMACAFDSPDPKALTAAMADDGDASDSAPDEPDRHGDSLAYQVSRVDSQPDMLAVVATLGIHCGTDSMLMLYGRTSRGGWRELMVRRSAPYREVKGGWGDLRFAVSPRDKQGRWFVATASTTPWCTSAWQGMPFELARPGSAPDRPDILFRGKDVHYLGNESDLLLKAERDAFEIRHDGGSVDPDILIRRHVRRYEVTGESVRRVQPVAENVRDFVDEWVSSSWSEAKAWSASDPALAAAHSALQAARWKTLGGFASIRSCTGEATQIELAGNEASGWFMIVRGGASGPWTLERVARRPAAGCTGPDTLDRQPA
jgi:hypothetical protein